MAGELTFRCEVCGTQKQKSNHWFLVFQGANDIRVRAWDLSTASRNKLVKTVCGQACVHRLIDAFFIQTSAVRAPASVPQNSSTVLEPADLHAPALSAQDPAATASTQDLSDTSAPSSAGAECLSAVAMDLETVDPEPGGRISLETAGVAALPTYSSCEPLPGDQPAECEIAPNPSMSSGTETSERSLN